MGIKIEPIEQYKKFKPFKLTIDITNESEASMIYALLNAATTSNSIRELITCNGHYTLSFNANDDTFNGAWEELDKHFESMGY